MIRLCCRRCRVRFAAVPSSHLTACPECGGVLMAVDGPGGVVGFRLFDPRDIADTLPGTLAVSLPPEPHRGR